MPLYDGIGLISEKHAVVIDIGSAYTKAGFAGETGPRCIIPTEVPDRVTGKLRKLNNYVSSKELEQLLADFIHHIYFKHLLVNPKDRRIVVVESVLTTTVFRETLAQVLFGHFEVSSLVFVPSHLMALFTLGVSSALVVDVGYEETQVFPIYEGVLMLNSGESIPLAGKAIHESIETCLLESCSVQVQEKKQPLIDICSSLDETVLEDIKVRACFVTPSERARWLHSVGAGDGQPPKPPPDLAYPFEGDKIIYIPGTYREKCAEVLFELDNDMKSVATVILDTIIECPIDLRRTLAENLVVIGGTAMITGFKARLKSELLSLLSHPHYQNRIAIKAFKFHKPPAKENYTSWLGAAIFGATDVLTTRSITKEQYTQNKCVPDWSNLKRVGDEENNV